MEQKEYTANKTIRNGPKAFRAVSELSQELSEKFPLASLTLEVPYAFIVSLSIFFFLYLDFKLVLITM